MVRLTPLGRRFPRTFPGDGKPQRLLAFLGLNCALGVAGGVAFAAVIILSNVGGIGDLLEASSEPVIPMILFFASCALTFGSIVMGAAVMMLPLEAAGPDDEPADEAAADDGHAEDGKSAEAGAPRLLGRRE